MTYAVDAAVAVALANTLFFAAATAESMTNVALYLAITVAPFAVVAPVIGPLLDRLQRGRRAALAVSFAGRAVLAVVMAFGYDTWVLYPAALGRDGAVQVVRRAQGGGDAAGAARGDHARHHELPAHHVRPGRGRGVRRDRGRGGGGCGARRARCSSRRCSPWRARCCACGSRRGSRSPTGEVPRRARRQHDPRARRERTPMGRARRRGAVGQRRHPRAHRLPHAVRRVRRQGADRDRAHPAAAAHRHRRRGRRGRGRSSATRRLTAAVRPVRRAWSCAAVGARWSWRPSRRSCPASPRPPSSGSSRRPASALAKVSLDAVIQRDLPEESRASAFGRSETVLQLAWVTGGALGVLLPHDTFLARLRGRRRRAGRAGRGADRLPVTAAAASPAVPRRRAPKAPPVAACAAGTRVLPACAGIVGWPVRRRRPPLPPPRCSRAGCGERHARPR